MKLKKDAWYNAPESTIVLERRILNLEETNSLSNANLANEIFVVEGTLDI